MPIELQSQRMSLRGFSPQEIKQIFESYPKAEVMTQMGHVNEADYETEAQKVKNGYAAYNRDFLLFLLIHKEHGEIIGRCGIHNWNRDHHRAEIGYNMSIEKYKQLGLMSEALSVIIPYGFEHLGLHRMEALVGSENVPSLRLMEKFGFQAEGRLRQHWLVEGQYVDSLVFGKLNFE